MKTLSTLVLLTAVAGGCGRGERTAPPEPARNAAPDSTSPGDEHDIPNELRVAADMLRDVRMTTTAVERRAAAESSSTLLGELQVNERRYGEVVAPVPGRIARVMADVGQRVRAGEPLAEMHSTDVGRARAAQVSARSRLELAQRALERKRTLADERIAPLREVQEAEADLRAAQSDVRAAGAELQALGVSAAEDDAPGEDSSLLLLRAPVDGVVIERTVVVGQATAAATPLFRVGDLSTLWLVVHAFERDAVRVTTGTDATVSFAALPGESFQGRIALVGRQVNVASRTVPVRIEVANPAGRLAPGMSASVTLPIGAATASILTVPVASLQRLGDEWVVFLPKPDGHFDIRPIGRGRDFGNEVEVVRGLTAGEIVVVDGAFVLKAEADKAGGAGADHDH